MANFPVFPRFPTNFPDSTSDMMWRLLTDWGNNLRMSLQTEDIITQQRKVEKDENGSIEVNGRVKVSDVAATIGTRAGDIRFNSSTNKFPGFDGTTWQDFH